MTMTMEQAQPTADGGGETQSLDAQYGMCTYRRQPVVFVRGEGMRLWDAEGREYLDFLGGIAVVLVGHCHPRVSRAIAEQAASLVHVSNLYYNALQPRLAERLCALTGMDRAFFCNSGAEAVETALKTARKWGKAKRGAACTEIVTFAGSFHGRTMGAVSATAQPKYQEPFAPLVPGFKYAPLGDLETVSALVGEHTCAVLVEPIQGESGIHQAPAAFLRALRTLCVQREVLLICDEIQCGMGRTGTFLASQAVGVLPDIVTLAKGLANGVPIGVCLARGSAAETLVPGDHGSTFGGQPLACAAALATLETLDEEGLLKNAARVGAYLSSGIEALAGDLHGVITEVRGRGLMIGVELAAPRAKALQARLLDNGVIVNATGDTTLRLLPPLIATESDCDRFLAVLRDVLADN